MNLFGTVGKFDTLFTLERGNTARAEPGLMKNGRRAQITADFMTDNQNNWKKTSGENLRRESFYTTFKTLGHVGMLVCIWSVGWCYSWDGQSISGFGVSLSIKASESSIRWAFNICACHLSGLMPVIKNMVLWSVKVTIYLAEIYAASTPSMDHIFGIHTSWTLAG